MISIEIPHSQEMSIFSISKTKFLLLCDHQTLTVLKKCPNFPPGSSFFHTSIFISQVKWQASIIYSKLLQCRLTAIVSSWKKPINFRDEFAACEWTNLIKECTPVKSYFIILMLFMFSSEIKIWSWNNCYHCDLKRFNHSTR